MPGGDRTGPLGYGPMTGRAMGYCAGYDIPGFANPCFGRGFGRGYGRGFRRRFWREPVNLTKEEEAKILEAELKEIEAEKEAIEKRLKEMK